MAETGRQAPGVDAERVLDRLPAGVVSFLDDGTIVYANATLAALLGYERRELEGRRVETLMTIAGRIFLQTHLYPVVRLHGRADEMFVLLRHASGNDVGVLLNASRRVVEGTAIIECVMMEVRERRKFEDALLRAKQVAESANAALSARSAELESANELLEDQAVELEAQQNALEEQAAELEIRGADLELARDAAQNANNAKSQFLAVMSHELRTPLNAIGGYVQLIELGIHGPVTDPQQEALGRITRAQVHLLRLIDDVLNLSRIEAGRTEYVREPVDTAELVDSVLPMLEPQMAAAGLSSRVNIEGRLVAIADREKVQQILINLLTNAVKFTPPGGTIITEGRPAPGVIQVSVTDSGIGIPQDKLASIFEPFVQVETGHTRRREGTGLGLAISRDLARGMGGDLTVSSVEGRGSTFTLSLPTT